MNIKVLGGLLAAGAIGAAAAIVLPALGKNGDVLPPQMTPEIAKPAPATAAQVAMAQPTTQAATTKDASRPVYETTIKRVCHPQQVAVQVDVPDEMKPAERNSMGMLLGAAGGALLGNQVGGGNGKTLATIAGAAGGAYVGDKMANNAPPPKQTSHSETRTSTIEVCNDVAVKTRVR